MATIKQFIAGQEVNRRNYDDLTITLDSLNGRAEPSITVDKITLVGEQGNLIRARVLNGLTGGVGIYEGEPSYFEVSDNGVTETFNGYLDFTDSLEFIGDCEVSCTFKKEQGTDWLNDVAGGFTYRYLYDIGIIEDSDFIDIPYVINYIPDGIVLSFLAQSVFSLTVQFVRTVESISESIKDLTNAATPVVGTSVGLGAGVVTAYDIGDIIGYSLALAFKVVTAIALGYAIGLLITQIREQLMPLKRYHKGISVKNLFVKACEYLNLNLVSTLLDEIDKGGQRRVFMPQKAQKGSLKLGDRTTATGLPLENSLQDNVDGVIQTYSSIFNADFKIIDGTFYFERIDKFKSPTTYVIPDTFTDQSKLQDLNGFNTNEIVSNYSISWAYDSQDLNTLDNQDGRVFQAKIEPKTTTNTKLRNLKGSRYIKIPMALSVRKNELTAIEKAVKTITEIGDSLTGQLGKATSLSGKINNRIGVMNLSNHITSTDKLVVMAGSKLATNQRGIVSAANLWENYHYINSFVPDSNGVHNQYWLYSEQEIPFCMSDFVSLKNGSEVVTQTGEKAEIELLNWKPTENKATITYRVNRLFDNNFNLVKL